MTIPVFFINLDKRVDRRAFMERQLRCLGIEAERIAAVASADIRAPLGGLSASQTACYLSHVEAWTRIGDCGAPFGLVLEDDAILSPILPLLLDRLAAEPPAFEVIRIEKPVFAVKAFPPYAIGTPGLALREVRSVDWGAAGYLISPERCRQLIGLRRVAPVDLLLFDASRTGLGRTRVAYSDPALCVQINNSGGLAPHSPGDIADRWQAVGRRPNIWERVLNNSEAELRRYFVEVSNLRFRGAGLAPASIPFAGECSADNGG